MMRHRLSCGEVPLYDIHGRIDFLGKRDWIRQCDAKFANTDWDHCLKYVASVIDRPRCRGSKSNNIYPTTFSLSPFTPSSSSSLFSNFSIGSSVSISGRYIDNPFSFSYLNESMKLINS